MRARAPDRCIVPRRARARAGTENMELLVNLSLAMLIVLLMVPPANSESDATPTFIHPGQAVKPEQNTLWPVQSSCNVLSHKLHAHGDGRDDTVALQNVLDDPDCSEVLLPPDRTFSASVLWVRRSSVVLTISHNTTLRGLPAKFRQERPDCMTEDGLEFNWHNWCALLRIEAQRNFTLRGEGTLAPGGVGGKAPDFYSALHVRSTTGVVLTGVRVHCSAWWWCTALHNSSDVLVSRLFIDGRFGRDGMDFVNCRRVTIEDSRIEGSDDGLCFKTIANNGLGRFPMADVVVRRTKLLSTWCNAIQFGSATEVDMQNFTFEDLLITGARKAAIGIVSMDSANISGLTFRNIEIQGRNVATPLFIKLGNRVRGEDDTGHWPPGSISDVNFTAIRCVGWGNVSDPKPGHGTAYTATIEGLNSSHSVGPITLKDFDLVAPGGGSVHETLIDPPISPLDYQPRYNGIRPSWGLFVRFVRHLAVVSSSLSSATFDGRPAMVMDQVHALVLSNVTVGGATAHGCQFAFRNSSGNWTDASACAWTPRLR